MIVNYSDEEVLEREKSIFLAGPTPRDSNTQSWRNDALEKLKVLDFDGVIYVPEFSTGAIRANFDDQALWERKALTVATVILFWVPRSLSDMPGFTTNVEFGYWLHTKKVLYGRPDNAAKIKYIDWLYKTDYGLDPINNLDELLQKAVAMVEYIFRHGT